MKFTFAHNNFNVIDLDKSLKFYEEALGLKEVRRKEAADGSFILVYLGDATTGYQLELTWLRDRTEPYNLGDNEIHLAVRVEDKAAVNRARRIQRFLSQPFHVAENFTGMAGKYVPLDETIRGFEAILGGECDDIPEQAFLFCGSIDDVLRKRDALQ